MDARVAELSALPVLDRSQRRELSSLQRLDRTLGRTSTRLATDFAKLAAAALAARRLGTAGEPFADEIEAGFDRTEIALNEREDYLGDHLALLPSGRDKDRVQRRRVSAATARQRAESAATPDARARLLKGAERQLTAALRLSEKTVLRRGESLPPARLRSGDSIGSGGARVAVPRGVGSSLEGTSIVLPPGALPIPAPVTIGPADTFVGGRNTPAGPAVTISPAVLEVEATLHLLVALPGDASPADLAVFRDDGNGGTPVPGPQLGPDGTVSVRTLQLGTFQPGVQAPPLGAPDGRYVVTGFAVIGGAGTTSTTDPVFHPNFSAGVLSQEFVFRRDGSGTALTGAFSVLIREFRPAAPHHAETTSFAPSSYDFLWTSDGDNRFSFTFPVPPTDTATVRGVASTEGDVIVFTARGGVIDFVAVGVRAGAGVTIGDLEGRWAAVSQGVALLDGGQEPFRTRWTSGSRNFGVTAGGVLTFDEAGTVFRSELAYETQLTDPTHSVSGGSDGDGGSLTLTALSDGSVQDSTNLVRGIYAPSSGLLVLASLDGTARTAELIVAAKQPDVVPAANFEGDWHAARFETGITAGSPDARSSAQELLGRLGTLAVSDVLAAAEDLDAGTRASIALTGAPPISGMSWTQSRATTAVAASARDFVLDPDASGNHRAAGDDVWWSVSGDGRFLLGALTGADGRLSTGIVLGVR